MGHSPLTYAGAAALLGKIDRPVLDVVDRAVGSGILLGAIVFPPALGLVDAKMELTRIVRGLLDTVSGRVRGAQGRDRHDLIAAAHTTLVLSALFDAISEHIGPSFGALELSDAEKVQLASAPGDVVTQTSWIDHLVRLDLPLPSPRAGFEENIQLELVGRVDRLIRDAVAFFEGLRVWKHLGVDSQALRTSAVRRWEVLYRERYLRLGVDAPEFLVWASLGEHAATRFDIGAMGARVTSLLRSQSETLGKLYDLLALTVAAQRPERASYRWKLISAATAVLQKPLLRSESTPDGLSFPSVADGFITPRFRVAVADPSAAPAQESWWSRQPVRTDLDEFMAGYLAHPDAARCPLVVLGHPGAGKSLLSNVLAARLPAEGFTVVPVQLRRVNPEDSILNQVESALRDVLHDTVTWGRLADESAGLTRVIILDGFDELVQATGVTQSGYLAEVRRFQTEEHDLGRAVAVIVTSRTLVVDRARVPEGSLLMKLEDFDDEQIAAWLSNWNRANRGSPGFRPLSLAAVRVHRALAGQPLLLTMLAMYAADRDAPTLDDAEMSMATLYERLLDTFIRRQVIDKQDRAPTGTELERLLNERRWRLSVAAFAMFNRGRQHVSDHHLDHDLDALTRAEATVPQSGFHAPLTHGQRTVADFFFIHTAQADKGSGDDRRTYEFLHATFGEYLIAERLLRLIAGFAAGNQLYLSDPSAHEPADDSMIRALLSHEPLQQRRPVVEFAQQIAARMPATRRGAARAAVGDLLATARARSAGSYGRYEPVPVDVVRMIAAYTANLVTFAVLLSDRPPSLRQLAPPGADCVDWWRSTVRLWRSGLTSAPWRSLVTGLVLDSGDDGASRCVELVNGDADANPQAIESLEAALLR
ncbi:hypothetical protein AB0M36_06765 [Actinoplanes sp. NPDC051346]|uniref:NACHT domain-containing protein n=1 Tax=Actinoplanes sp. NPDC051346 TaxID=3155048 RepID=UPI00343DE810